MQTLKKCFASRLAKIVLLLVMALPHLAATDGSKATPEMQIIQSRYDKLKTVSAKFKQEIISPRFGSKVSEGKVFFKFPGKMRWEYAKPDEKVLVSDGKRSWLYDAADRQALVGSSGIDKTAMSFLWGKQRLHDFFTQHKVQVSKAKIQLELKPRKPMAEVEKLRVIYDKKKSIIVQVTVFDPSGNRNRISFEKIAIDRSVKNELFVFDVPKGTQVIETEPMKIKQPANAATPTT